MSKIIFYRLSVIIASVVFFLYLLPLFAAESATETTTPNLGLQISKAWLRPTVSGQTVTGVYFQLTARQAGKLVGVESDGLKAELHEMSMQGDVMHMRQRAEIVVAEGETLQFAPGGLHVMLMGLTRPILVGQQFTLHVLFQADQQEGVLRIPVQAVASHTSVRD